MQPNICQTKYYPFPHSWSKPQLILKFRNKSDAALLHFTSGTTGMPGVLHVHHAVFTHYVTGKYVLDFHEGIGFGTADPVG
jgi:acetyl-CoA synthetase